MENLLSLMIVVIVFASLLVVVAYMADTLAVAVVEWLGLTSEEEDKSPIVNRDGSYRPKTVTIK